MAADPVQIACPECGKKVNVRPDILGKKVRCKECDEVYVAKAVKAAAKAVRKPQPEDEPEDEPAKPAKPAKSPFADDDEDDAPIGVTGTVDGYRCPECAEDMEGPDAIICLNCGYNTRTRERAKTRRVHDNTGGDYFLWLLPGILCVLGIIGLAVGDTIYCLNIDDWLEGKDAWWADLITSFAVKLWLCVISVFAAFFMGKFAFFRLIMSPHPPEVERYH
jgi:hypothetical protein